MYAPLQPADHHEYTRMNTERTACPSMLSIPDASLCWLTCNGNPAAQCVAAIGSTSCLPRYTENTPIYPRKAGRA